MNRVLRCTVAAALLAFLSFTPLSLLVGQERTVERSSPEAVEAYRDAANLQNNEAFDVAAEEWLKFLKNHPKDPLTAKAQHYLGVCQLQLKQPEAAAASFAAVIKNHPKFELLEDAYLNLATCQYSLATAGNAGMHAKAAETFAALLAAFPKGKHVEEALFYQGESLYAQGNKAAAVPAYMRLVREFPQSKRRADALYALGVTHEELGKHTEAAKTYEVFLKDYADRPLATEVRMRKAETMLLAGDIAGAERVFAQVAAVKDFAAADHARFRQAFCLAKLEKLAPAAEAFAKVAIEFPKSSYVPDATISAGRCFYRAGDMSAAKEWLEKALALNDAGAAEAAHWLCRILIKSRQAPAAADLAAKQLGKNPQGPFVANLRLDQADALFEIPGRRADALALYTRFASEHPRHELVPQAHYNAAFTALELKRFDEGLKSASAFLKSFPNDKLSADVMYVAAECNLQLKRYDEARSLYRELAEKYPSHPDLENWRVRLGLVAYLQKKYDAGVAHLAPLVRTLRSPAAKAEAHFLIGASYFHGDKFSDAAVALNDSLQADPHWRQSDEALLLLARSLTKLGEAAHARLALEKMISEFPDSSMLDQAHYRLGELAYAADDFPAAIAKYDLVATRFADSSFAPYALYGIGWSHLKSKNFPKGTASFTALLTRFPQHELQAEARFGRALCRRQSGDAKGAITDIDAYLKSNPERSQKSNALYERGIAQVAASDFAGAVVTLTGLLKTDPNYPADKVLYEIGWALKSQDKHAEAAVRFSEIATEHSGSPLAAEAWFHVGENRYENKEFAEAAKAYAMVKAKSQAGELFEKATHKLGWAHFQLKDYESALAQFGEQLAAFPQGALAADARFMKAECLFRQENYKEAWPAYQAALKTKASTPTIEVLTLLHAGQSAAQVQLWDESIKMLTTIQDKSPDTPLLAEALYELGWAKQNVGQASDALNYYEAAATRSRDHVGARARFMIGELLFSQKHHDRAIREFQRAMFGYGSEQASPETKNWQAKAGYEAGRCAEVLISSARDSEAKRKHQADATRFYTFVMEKHPAHELAAEAKSRIRVLGER